MKCFLHICLFSLFFPPLFAQPTAKDIIERVNQHLLSVDQGAYTARYRKVSMLQTDTAYGKGRVLFSKRNSAPLKDSIARFVFWANDTNIQAFDGQYYFTVFEQKKLLSLMDVALRKGIKDYISHYNILRLYLLSAPILTINPYTPLDESEWEGATLDLTEKDGLPMWRLTTRNTFPVRQRLSPKDSDSTRIIQELWVDTLRNDLRLHRLFVDQGNGLPHFGETEYSGISLIPDSLWKEREYDLNHWFSRGYSIAEKQDRMEVIPFTIGDSIPEVTLGMADSSNLSLFEGRKARYSVVDFWYRGCAPCNMAMPDIDRLYRSYGGKQVDFIALNCFDTDRQKIQELYRSFGYRFPIFFGEKALSQQLRVTSHPTLWVIDNSTRRIVYKHTGHSEENTQNLEEVLKSLNE